MSSVMLCSKCGGTVGAAVPGKKACTCKQSAKGAVATIDAPTGPRKLCVTCGKDVTHEKRMKDSSTGKYWCYECGVKQPGSQTQAIVCPICKKHMSPLAMYRDGDHYICQHCHDGKKTMKGKQGGGSGKVVMACIAVLLIAAVSAYLNGWLPV